MTTALELGTIEKVDIREVWPTENEHFTPWLGDNLEKLGAELSLELELVEAEAQVGQFRLDVRAYDANIRGEIIIENQFGQTDHSHLGQLLTYASGFDAGVVVWIAEKFRAEHLAALDYLNRRTGEDTQFFGVEIELWRIGGSLAAPHFNIIATPNEWRKQNVIRNQTSGSVSERQERYRTFFQQLIDTMREKYNFTGARVGRPQSWYRFASGFSSVAYIASFKVGQMARVELYIDKDDKDWNESLFDELENERETIQSELGETLEWRRLDNRRACRIEVVRPGSIDDSSEALQDIQGWMVDYLLKFKEVFGPRLTNLVD